MVVVAEGEHACSFAGATPELLLVNTTLLRSWLVAARRQYLMQLLSGCRRCCVIVPSLRHGTAAVHERHLQDVGVGAKWGAAVLTMD